MNVNEASRARRMVWSADDFMPTQVTKGDYQGHPFRGNQWSNASGSSTGATGSAATFKTTSDENDAQRLGAEINRNAQPLTRAERDALRGYGNEGFQDINNYLRYQKDTEFASAEQAEIVKDDIRLINDVLNRQTLGQNVILYRYTDNNMFDFLDVGDEFHDEAFQSTTLLREPQGVATSAVFVIQAPATTRGRYIENEKQRKIPEFEVLLAAGAKYRVLEVTESFDGLKEIRVDLIGQGSDVNG